MFLLRFVFEFVFDQEIQRSKFIAMTEAENFRKKYRLQIIGIMTNKMIS